MFWYTRNFAQCTPVYKPIELAGVSGMVVEEGSTGEPAARNPLHSSSPTTSTKPDTLTNWPAYFSSILKILLCSPPHSVKLEQTLWRGWETQTRFSFNLFASLEDDMGGLIEQQSRLVRIEAANLLWKNYFRIQIKIFIGSYIFFVKSFFSISTSNCQLFITMIIFTFIMMVMYIEDEIGETGDQKAG